MPITRPVYTKILSVFFAALALTAIGTTPSRAEYPDRPITLLATHAAGGGIDIFARTMAGFMQDTLGQPVVVVNKTGAAGIIAARATIEADPDGYTLLLANMASIIAKTMMDGEKAAIEPLKDLESLGGVGQLVTGLFVPINSPFKTAGDLVKWAKENPGKLRWAHSGRGSFHMIAGASFLKALDIKAKDIPFKGGSTARTALVGEQVDCAFIGIQLLTGFESKLRALGVPAEKRDPVMSDVPTLAEQGLGAVDITGPIAILGSPKLPDGVKAKLRDAIKKAAENPAYMEATKKAGLAGFYVDPATSKKKMSRLEVDFEPVIDEIKAK